MQCARRGAGTPGCVVADDRDGRVARAAGDRRQRDVTDSSPKRRPFGQPPDTPFVVSPPMKPSRLNRSDPRARTGSVVVTTLQHFGNEDFLQIVPSRSCEVRPEHHVDQRRELGVARVRRELRRPRRDVRLKRSLSLNATSPSVNSGLPSRGTCASRPPRVAIALARW